MCDWSSWSNLNFKLNNCTIALIPTIERIYTSYEAYHWLAHAALYPSLHTATECVKPRWSAMCLFTSQSMRLIILWQVFHCRHQVRPIAHKLSARPEQCKAAIFTALKSNWRLTMRPGCCGLWATVKLPLWFKSPGQVEDNGATLSLNPPVKELLALFLSFAGLYLG